MQNPLLKATLQSAFLTLCSALVATFLTTKDPPIIALVIFSFLATPPNFIWQQYLEQRLPGYKLEKAEANGEAKIGTQDGASAGKGVVEKRRLILTNTLLKVVIDQTLVAVVNVALHIGVVRALRGVPLRDCVRAMKEVRSWLRLEHTLTSASHAARMVRL